MSVLVPGFMIPSAIRSSIPCAVRMAMSAASPALQAFQQGNGRREIRVDRASRGFIPGDQFAHRAHDREGRDDADRGHSAILVIHWFKIDPDPDSVIAAAQDHAADRADVAEVAAPAEQDMLVLDHDAVGWIDVDPAVLGTQPAADPGVGLVGALAFGLARRRLGADVAGGVAGRNTDASEAADHGVGEILADAFPAGHDLGDGGGDGGDAGAKPEFGVDAFVQVQQGLQHRAAFGEGFLDIGFGGGVDRGHRGAELEFHRLPAVLGCGPTWTTSSQGSVVPAAGGGGQSTSTTDSDVTSKSAWGRSRNSQVT